MEIERIKKKIALKGSNKKRVAALITGRGGSRSIKNKNITPLLNRPLLSYPIIHSAYSNLIDEVFFTTDSKLLADVAGEWGAEIIMRPAELGEDDKHAEAMVDGFKQITARWGYEPDILVILMANCPTITPGIIDEGIKFITDDKELEYDSAVTVSQYNEFNPVRARRVENGKLVAAVDPDIFVDKNSELGHDRNSAGDFYFCDGAAWIVRKTCLLDIDKGNVPYRWIGKNVKALHQKDAFDVDNLRTLASAEFFLRRTGFTETNIPL